MVQYVKAAKVCAMNEGFGCICLARGVNGDNDVGCLNTVVSAAPSFKDYRYVSLQFILQEFWGILRSTPEILVFLPQSRGIRLTPRPLEAYVSSA